jgi:hypothetical protein
LFYCLRRCCWPYLEFDHWQSALDQQTDSSSLSWLRCQHQLQ